MMGKNLTQSLSKSASLFVVVALALAAVFVTACSSGQASSAASSSSVPTGSSASAVQSSGSAASQPRQAVDHSEFVGTWNMIDMEKDGVRASEVNPDAVGMMREEYYLNIAEDQFVNFIHEGQVIQSVMMAISPTEAKMAYGTTRDDAIPMVIDGGILVFGPIEGTTMYFEKGEPRETPPLPEGEADLRERLGY